MIIPWCVVVDHALTSSTVGLRTLQRLGHIKGQPPRLCLQYPILRDL